MIGITTRRVLLATLAMTLGLAAVPARAEGPQLAHMVFFTLAEPSEATARQLVDGCKAYLKGHEGTAYFSVGTRGKEFAREVNDQEFDVALHLVFEDKAAHDTYQANPRHLKFIEECASLWSKVRVFDSYVDGE